MVGLTLLESPPRGLVGEGKGMESCEAPQGKSAEAPPSNSSPPPETEQSFQRTAHARMKEDLAQLKLLMAKFSQQLEEWPAQT